jgi:hypothetical protein
MIITTSELEQIRRLPPTMRIDPHEEPLCGTFVAQKANTALQEYIEGFYCCCCIPCCWRTKKISILPRTSEKNLAVRTFKCCGYVGKYTNLFIIHEGMDRHLGYSQAEYDLNTNQSLSQAPKPQVMYDTMTETDQRIRTQTDYVLLDPPP